MRLFIPALSCNPSLTVLAFIIEPAPGSITSGPLRWNLLSVKSDPVPLTIATFEEQGSTCDETLSVVTCRVTHCVLGYGRISFRHLTRLVRICPS